MCSMCSVLHKQNIKMHNLERVNKMNNFLLWLLQYLGIPLGILACVRFYNNSLLNSKLLATLSGKVVFISGASSGVGEALAHVFYSCGCKVVLAARRLTELERVKKDLMALKTNSQTFEPIVVGLDLSDFDTLDRVVQDTYRFCGHVDILINNGGISSRGSILDTNLHVHTRLMNVNYFGPIGLTKAILPKMIERKTGHIVFVSSVQGRIAIPERAAYSASKHACQAFADVLRAEVARDNINVSVISPGYIQTALSLNALTGSGGLHGVVDSTTASGYKPEYVAEKILKMVINKENELTLAPFSPKVAMLLRTITPSLYFWIMAKRAK